MAKRKKKKGSEVSVRVGGSVKGDMKVAGGDIGEGDQISVGNISGSTGVAIGRGAKATVNQTSELFGQMREQLGRTDLPDFKKEEASGALDELEAQAQKEEPEQDKVDYYLGKLEELAPDIVELLINAVTNPGAAVGKGLKLAIRAWREARKG